MNFDFFIRFANTWSDFLIGSIDPRTLSDNISPQAFIALLLLIVAVIIFLPSREVGNKTVTLLRVLFPSWRFFDEYRPIPQLQYRYLDDSEDEGWYDAIPQSHRRWHSAIINPVGNLFFAYQSLLENLENEIEVLSRRFDSGSEMPENRCTSFKTSVPNKEDLSGQDELIALIENTTAFRLVENLVVYQMRLQKHDPSRSSEVPQCHYQFRIIHRDGADQDAFLISSVRTLHG